MIESTETKNVLVIAYYFPPMGGSGVQRVLKFVKYLRDFGWNPIVLCPEPGAYHTFDTSLEDELNSFEVEVHRVAANTPLHKMGGQKTVKLPVFVEKTLRAVSTFFWLPDNKKGWIEPALYKASEIIEGKRIDVIFATAPPYSNFILAKQMKELFNIPVVMDFRDDWLESHLFNYPTKWHYSKMKNIESETLRAADQVITINQYIASAIDAREIAPTKAKVITHGFDSEDFTELNNSFQKKEKLTFLYSGTFYPESGPEVFLKAFASLLEAHPELRDKAELQFQGGLNELHKSLIKNLKLDAIVKDFGYVNHGESVKNLMNADILWLNNSHSKKSFTISLSKTYEYMATLKPVLALIPEGDTKETLKSYKASFIVNPVDEKALKDKILNIFQLWSEDALPVPDKEYVMKFDRKGLTSELASIFNVISS